MLRPKLLFPWREESTKTMPNEETQSLKNIIKQQGLLIVQKDQLIYKLEKENEALRNSKTVHVTHIDHVSTYVKNTDAVVNFVKITPNDETMNVV